MKNTVELNDFETNMKRLEDIARTLEENNCSLDEMVKLYEEGMSLSSAQMKLLDKVQTRLKEITINSDENIMICECEINE